MSEEARKNLIALGTVGVVLVVLTGFAMWPSVPIGVHRGPLAESIANVSEDGRGRPGNPNSDRCTETGDGAYECEVAIGGPSDAIGRKYTVEVGRTGCWQARAIARHNPDIEGCIRLWDVFVAD
jgi:hypothetical protein